MPVAGTTKFCFQYISLDFGNAIPNKNSNRGSVWAACSHSQLAKYSSLVSGFKLQCSAYPSSINFVWKPIIHSQVSNHVLNALSS